MIRYIFGHLLVGLYLLAIIVAFAMGLVELFDMPIIIAGIISSILVFIFEFVFFNVFLLILFGILGAIFGWHWNPFVAIVCFIACPIVATLIIGAGANSMMKR